MNRISVFICIVAFFELSSILAFSKLKFLKYMSSKCCELKSSSDVIDLKQNDYLTFNEIEQYALISGIIIKSSETGPYLRLDAYPIGDSTPIGYLTAFIRPYPIGLFHLETIQVKNRRQTLGFKRSGWTIDGPGISFLMGTWALKWAYDRGCKTAQLLAVDDSSKMQRILIKLYSSFGFKTIKYIKDELSFTIDRIVWGAVGTLMEIDMTEFMCVWSPRLRDMLINSQNKINQRKD